MGRKPDDKRVEILFSPEQYEELSRIAKRQRLGIAHIIRQAVAVAFPSVMGENRNNTGTDATFTPMPTQAEQKTGTEPEQAAEFKRGESVSYDGLDYTIEVLYEDCADLVRSVMGRTLKKLKIPLEALTKVEE